MTDRDDLVARFSVWDYVVFVFMLCVSAAIGIYYACSGGKQSTTREFLMGNRSLKVVPVALSVLASFMSAITLLGTASEMYQFGTQYWVIVVSYFLVIPSAAYLYMPIFYNLQLTSAYEYLELRFNRVVRSMGSIVFSLQMIIYMAIVLYAPSLALSQVTGIEVWTSVLSIGIVCTFYTSVGGIKAVVWTDVFQIVLMYMSMFAIVIKGANDQGGLGQVWQKAYEGMRVEFFNFNPDPTDRHTVWGLIIGCYFTWLAIYGVSQAMVQRYLTIPKLRGARQAIWINLPGLAILLTICSLSGLVLYARYHDCDPIATKKVTAPDQLLPLFVMDTLGLFPGIPGLFVSGIFSGALSTVSSGVNSLAAVTLEDGVKVFYNKDISEKTATLLTKILAVGYGVIAILLVYVAQQLGNVLQAALAIFGIIGGPLLGVFTLGIFFPWANGKGAATGLLGSLAISLWIGFGSFASKPSFPKAPFSVEGCIEEYMNITGSLNATLPTTPDPAIANQEIFVLYRISYVWYSMIGTFLVVIFGMIVSVFTGLRRPGELDPRLISPIYNVFVRLLVPKKHHEKFLVPSEAEFKKDSMVSAVVGIQNGKSKENGNVNLSFTPSSEDLHGLEGGKKRMGLPNLTTDIHFGSTAM